MSLFSKTFIGSAVALTLLMVAFLALFMHIDIYDASIEATYILLGFIGLYLFIKLKMTLPIVGWGFLFSSFIVDFLDEFDSYFVMPVFITDYYENLAFLLGLFIFIIGLYIEIVERAKKHAEIQRQSITDPLTQIYNRNHLSSLKEVLSSDASYPIGIIMTDLNGLKFVNDSFGHETGDHLLRQSIQILKKAINTEKDMLFRIGGDEILIFKEGTDLSDLNKTMKNIELECEKTNFMEIPVSFATGSYLIEDTSTAFEEALRIADDRMYLHKLLNKTSQGHQYIEALKSTLKEKSFETSEHDNRITSISRIIASYIELDKELIDALEFSSMFHDIGKIAVSESIINKPSKLNEKEWMQIKRHPEVGSRIINGVFPSPLVEQGVLAHHEKWDGSGYPSGLKEEEIPIIARVITIADAFDVMTVGRCYQDPISVSEALIELRQCSGTQFDPSLIQAFDRIIENNYMNIERFIHA